MGDLIQGWSLDVFPDNGLVEVSGVKAYAKGFIWLLGVCQGGHPFYWLSDRGDFTLVDHIL